jgi:hypothetical protein
MSLSSNFTARVPLVSELIKNNEDLSDLLRLIYDDAFFKKHHRNQIMLTEAKCSIEILITN